MMLSPQEFLPQHLSLWVDPVPRTGFFNMAADEVLSRRPEAWLRIYRWARPAVSFGYFDTTAEAARLFPGAQEYVRRWTGGGIVDHRSGMTYTLTLPHREGKEYPPASVLYRVIHGALAQALSGHGVACSLLAENAPDGGRACWASPVASDIVAADGAKLAGAGQRRCRGAVLHQGLIQQCHPAEGWEVAFASLLARHVTLVTDEEPFDGFAEATDRLMQEKYLSSAWADESHGRR